jgi:hypothetical protein
MGADVEYVVVYKVTVGKSNHVSALTARHAMEEFKHENPDCEVLYAYSPDFPDVTWEWVDDKHEQ